MMIRTLFAAALVASILAALKARGGDLGSELVHYTETTSDPQSVLDSDPNLSTMHRLAQKILEQVEEHSEETEDYRRLRKLYINLVNFAGLCYSIDRTLHAEGKAFVSESLARHYDAVIKYVDMLSFSALLDMTGRLNLVQFLTWNRFLNSRPDGEKLRRLRKEVAKFVKESPAQFDFQSLFHQRVKPIASECLKWPGESLEAESRNALPRHFASYMQLHGLERHSAERDAFDMFNPHVVNIKMLSERFESLILDVLSDLLELGFLQQLRLEQSDGDTYVLRLPSSASA